MRFKSVALDSYTLQLPEYEASSAEIEDRLAPLYERLKIPFGTLEKLSGVKTRRMWNVGVLPSEVALPAAQEALEKSTVPRERIGVIINCSVTRDYFEPGTSTIIHRQLELPETVQAFDITNACIGFSNGIQMVGMMIEQGVVDAGLVVTAENIACVVEASINHLLSNKDLTREQVLKILPTFTLGCGAAAAVVCRQDLSVYNHRIVGCTSRSATQHSNLCRGNADFHLARENGLNPIMYTESGDLILEASRLGRRMWEDFSNTFHWEREDIDHIFCHQVGKQVNKAFYEEMTLDMSKEFTTFQRYGNLVSASLPAAFFTGIEEKGIKEGEKILLTGFGSGLNSIFTGIEW
ncbi:MAG: 3-oxoacyl-ACP synthase III [Bdellovibrionales bacterium]|nr:3-oxoacyl-ACP synthase III [Bdellovibrionales bacterium]